MPIAVGFSKTDISTFEPGMAMLGWGREDNIPRGVAEPLYARAMVVRTDERALAYVCADLCFVSAALRQAVVDGLAREAIAIAPHDLLLGATHTHSGPNGFSHAFFYDLSGPGFSPSVFDALVGGILDAIRAAHDRAEPATLSLATATIPRREPVVFNRSPGAYARNREVRGPVHPEDAVDRELTVLRADDARGRPIGALAFFALHATSVHGDGHLLHPDHKGLAAACFERWARRDARAADDFVAIFAQGAAGDVSPNHRYDPARGFTVGRFDDDHDSAAYVAEVQSEAASEAFRRAPTELALEGSFGGSLVHLDMEARAVDGGFTTIGRLGIAMAEGTAEGPGPLSLLRALGPFGERVTHADGRDPKRLLLETGPGRAHRLFGLLDPTRVPLPIPAFAHARRARRGGGLVARPWIPTILPIQILRLGPFAIAALPNEPTTMAGRRLRAALEPVLAPQGVRRVLVQGYANAYSGYLTTPEEYGAQRYEGAYTLFGPRTLDAFSDALVALARAPRDPDAPIGPPLQLCTPAELAARRPG